MLKSGTVVKAMAVGDKGTAPSAVVSSPAVDVDCFQPRMKLGTSDSPVEVAYLAVCVRACVRVDNVFTLTIRHAGMPACNIVLSAHSRPFTMPCLSLIDLNTSTSINTSSSNQKMTMMPDVH